MGRKWCVRKVVRYAPATAEENLRLLEKAMVNALAAGMEGLARVHRERMKIVRLVGTEHEETQK